VKISNRPCERPECLWKHFLSFLNEEIKISLPVSVNNNYESGAKIVFLEVLILFKAIFFRFYKRSHLRYRKSWKNFNEFLGFFLTVVDWACIFMIGVTCKNKNLYV
jgi:hypothetical protein